MTKTKQQIIDTIKKHLELIDIKPYSHNIIGLQLNLLERVASQEAVIELVRTTELQNLGWGYLLQTP
tara:strand:- start:605 stop:805 length:201 start_codon:yes stop_codon:yes gene_type:complete